MLSTAYSMGSILKEIRKVARRDADDSYWSAAYGLVIHRALFLLRSASRNQILEEGNELSHYVYDPTRDLPDKYLGAWRGISALLAEAARRSDTAAIPSILRNWPGHAQKVLSCLAGEIKPISRWRLAKHAGMDGSSFQRMMGELLETDLIKAAGGNKITAGDRLVLGLQRLASTEKGEKGD